MDQRQVPGVMLDNEPGDMLLFSQCLIHASFGGDTRRRMFCVTCCPRLGDDQIDMLKGMLGKFCHNYWLDRIYETACSPPPAGSS